MPRLAGKVCVINGAASDIGRAVAERFTAEGAVVEVERVPPFDDRLVLVDTLLHAWVQTLYGTATRTE